MNFNCKGSRSALATKPFLLVSGSVSCRTLLLPAELAGGCGQEKGLGHIPKLSYWH